MVHYQSILARSNTSRTLLDLGWTWHRITRYVLFFIQSLRVWDGNVKYMRHVFFFYYPLNWNKLWRATSFFCSMTTNQDGWFLRRFLSFHIFKVVSVLFSKIEIKPCRLGSRIQNMEAERVKVPKCESKYDAFGLQQPLQPHWSKMIMSMLSRKVFATNSLK